MQEATATNTPSPAFLERYFPAAAVRRDQVPLTPGFWLLAPLPELPFSEDSSPQTTIQGPILDGFTEVLRGDLIGAGQICDRTRDFQDPIISSRAQIQIGNRFADQFDPPQIEAAMLLQQSSCHLTVVTD